ncbi:MAG: hypothetical protein ACTS5A_02770 [Candidatus Hodgkinia cicadicola]
MFLISFCLVPIFQLTIICMLICFAFVLKVITNLSPSSLMFKIDVQRMVN